MDDVLTGVLYGVRAIGEALLADDIKDTIDPNAHPGAHHWHLGVLMINGVDAWQYLDTLTKIGK